MEDQLIQLKKRTMRKIYTIWFFRYVLPILSLELIVLSAIILRVQSQVSFNHVFYNATSRALQYSFSSFGLFWLAAIFNTEVITQVLLAVGLVVGWLVVRDAMRISRQFRGNFLRVRHVN